MPRKYPKDLTGMVFHRLLVFGFSRKYRNENNGSTEEYWWCCCNCGNRVEVRVQNLFKGMTKSCGCLRTDKNKLRRKIKEAA